MVNILVVSHSRNLAKAAVEFVSEMKNGKFTLDYVAGINNGKDFGTDPSEIVNKIQKLTKNSELLIIYDLGSSKMNTEMAMSMLDSKISKKVAIANVAFVEGLLIAVTSNTDDVTIKSLKTTVESQAKVEK